MLLLKRYVHVVVSHTVNVDQNKWHADQHKYFNSNGMYVFL